MSLHNNSGLISDRSIQCAHPGAIGSTENWQLRMLANMCTALSGLVLKVHIQVAMKCQTSAILKLVWVVEVLAALFMNLFSLFEYIVVFFLDSGTYLNQ